MRAVLQLHVHGNKKDEKNRSWQEPAPVRYNHTAGGLEFKSEANTKATVFHHVVKLFDT